MKEMQELFVEHPRFSVSATKTLLQTFGGRCDLNIEEFLLLKRVIFASRELKNYMTILKMYAWIT